MAWSRCMTSPGVSSTGAPPSRGTRKIDQFSSAPLSDRKRTERPSGVVASTTTRCGHSTSRRAAALGSPTSATNGCGRPVRLETKTMPFPSRVKRPPELEKAST